MAIKLSGSLSRKLPIQGIPYSSENFSAGLEIEINSAEAGEVQARLAGLYDCLSQAIDTQIAAGNHQSDQSQGTPAINTAVVRSQPVPSPAQSAAPQRSGSATGRNRVATIPGNGNGSVRRITCTEAQAKCIYAVCKAQGLDMASVLADFNVADVRDLHVKDASRLIDQLKSQNGNGAAAH